MRRSARALGGAAAVLAVAVLVGCGGGSDDGAGTSGSGADRRAALDDVRVCVVNQLPDTIRPKVIIPSVVFQPDSLSTGGETCEKDYHLNGPDVCFDIQRGGQVIARVGAVNFLGNLTALNADRCENETAPNGRSVSFGTRLGTGEMGTATPGVKICLNRWDKFQLTAYVAPDGQACAYR